MNIEHLLNTYSLYLLIFGVVSLSVLAVVSLKVKNISNENKKVLFLAIVLVTMIPTLVMGGSTVYVNTISSSGGPVHWHADIEVWSCGNELDLRDPQGRFNNKIGTATLHEHNDKRIHLEGVVIEPVDASLGQFFKVIGGSIDESMLTVPVAGSELQLKSGDYCPGDVKADVQVFVYTTDENDEYAQRKLDKPQDYIISPNSIVPPGDCIIVEFSAPKERTDKLCRSYKVAEEIEKVSPRSDMRNAN